jgi:hypothetical protein
MGGDRSYPVAGRRVVMNTIRVVWGRPPVSFVGGAYAEGCVVGRCRESRIVGYGSHLCDNGAGASSNGRGDDADGGESVGLARKLLPVT